MWQIFHWLKEMLQAIAFVNINSEVVNLFKLMSDNISLVEIDVAHLFDNHIIFHQYW